MKITNLQQWYMLLDEKSNDLKYYEDTIDKYYKKLYSNLSEVYSKPIMTNFYKKDTFTKHIKDIILKTIAKCVPITFISAILYWIIIMIKNKATFLEAVKESGLSTILPSAIVGFVSLFVFTVICVGIKYLSYKRLCKKLDKQEQNLSYLLSTLPNSYRCFEKVKIITQIFFTGKNVDVNTALEVCDEYSYNNISTRPIISVMFDLPLNNVVVKNTTNSLDMPIDTNYSSLSEESNEVINEYLPSDINSKTFSGSENSESDLESMIGLESVKQQIEKLRNRIAFYGNSSNNGSNMVFLGGAGTGKTSVARIITKILFDLGYIKKNQYVEISGDYLRSGNSNRVSAIVEYSLGGVLFIDEAYLLYDKNGSGADATGILLKAMEDHRKDFVCILAGYEEQMTKLLASNEGFASRIKHTIYFQDYTVEEMYNIFTSFIGDYNGGSYTLNSEAKSLLLDTFELERRSKSFGNARTVRNAVDSIMDYYVDRCIKAKIKSRMIELEDVERYSKDRKNVLQHELKNMSASNQLDESIIRLSELKSKLKNGSEDIDKDLDKLVGLDSFKKEMNLLKSQKEFYNKIEQQKILFLGEDGCGKSSLTKILTGYLYKLGYIQENRFLDISADFLKGSYVGHTNKRAEAIISYASGGVLFIKNINALVHNEDSFSQEVITAITTALNENNNVTIVIADTESIYLNSIKNLFTIVYKFPTYNSEQLYKIFELQAYEDGFSIDKDAAIKLKNVISNMKTRDILRIYSNTKKNHINNFNGNDDSKFIIYAEDIDIKDTKDETKTIKLNIKL